MRGEAVTLPFDSAQGRLGAQGDTGGLRRHGGWQRSWSVDRLCRTADGLSAEAKIDERLAILGDRGSADGYGSIRGQRNFVVQQIRLTDECVDRAIGEIIVEPFARIDCSRQSREAIENGLC